MKSFDLLEVLDGGKELHRFLYYKRQGWDTGLNPIQEQAIFDACRRHREIREEEERLADMESKKADDAYIAWLKNPTL